jgi:hypothetical protein
MRADVAFPQASKGNKTVFYRADGTAKTVGELYASVVNRAPLQMSAPPANLPRPQMAAANVVTADMSDLLTSAAQTPTADANQIALSDDDEPQAPTLPTNAYALWTTPDRPPVVELRALPQQPVVLSPGVLEMLASLTPVAITRRAA